MFISDPITVNVINFYFSDKLIIKIISHLLFLNETAVLMGDSEQQQLTQQAPPVAGGDNAPGEETTESTPMVMRSPSSGEGDKSAKGLQDGAPTTGTYVDATDASAEKEPLKKNAKEEITVEVGDDANGKDGGGDQKSPDQLPAKKGCDVRCLVIGILVLAIMITGAAVAILAHRFKSEYQ